MANRGFGTHQGQHDEQIQQFGRGEILRLIHDDGGDVNVKSRELALARLTSSRTPAHEQRRFLLG
jgi:hypothetical protein